MKAQSKKIPVTVEPEPDKKVVERKKIVHDIIKQGEPCSSTRTLNEQRRMEFFSKEGPVNIIHKSEAGVETPQKSETVEPAKAQENDTETDEKQMSKLKEISEENKTKQGPKNSEVNYVTSKKSCTIL